MLPYKGFITKNRNKKLGSIEGVLQANRAKLLPSGDRNGPTGNRLSAKGQIRSERALIALLFLVGSLQGLEKAAVEPLQEGVRALEKPRLVKKCIAVGSFTLADIDTMQATGTISPNHEEIPKRHTLQIHDLRSKLLGIGILLTS